MQPWFRRKTARSKTWFGQARVAWQYSWFVVPSQWPCFRFTLVQAGLLRTMPLGPLISTKAVLWWPLFVAIHWTVYWVCSTFHVAYMFDLFLDQISLTTSSEAETDPPQQYLAGIYYAKYANTMIWYPKRRDLQQHWEHRWRGSIREKYVHRAWEYFRQLSVLTYHRIHAHSLCWRHWCC